MARLVATIQPPPPSKAARINMCGDLSSSRKAVAVPLDGPDNHSLLVLPPVDAAASLWLEFASVVVTPLPDMALPGGPSGGQSLMRVLEGRVEAMTFPAQSKINPTHSPLPTPTAALTGFERAAKTLVVNYVNQLMEEVTPEQASWLKDVDGDVRRREKLSRVTREQVEDERRQQETMLKDLRVAHQTAGLQKGYAVLRQVHGARHLAVRVCLLLQCGVYVLTCSSASAPSAPGSLTAAASACSSAALASSAGALCSCWNWWNEERSRCSGSASSTRSMFSTMLYETW